MTMNAKQKTYMYRAIGTVAVSTAGALAAWLSSIYPALSPIFAGAATGVGWIVGKLLGIPMDAVNAAAIASMSTERAVAVTSQAIRSMPPAAAEAATRKILASIPPAPTAATTISFVRDTEPPPAPPPAPEEPKS